MALTKIPASLLDTSGGLDLQGNITLGDSEKILLGASSDLQIYHDESGGHSRIDDTGTGGLVIRGSQVLLEKYGGGYMMNAVADGASELYHAGSKKFETTSTGATVTGDLAVTGDLNITGNVNSASVTDLDVTDKTITLGAGQTEALSGGSGIIVDGSGASILWDETNTEFDINNTINVTGAVVSSANGAITTANGTTARFSVSETGGATTAMDARGSTGNIGTRSNHTLGFLVNDVQKATLTANGDLTVVNDLKLTTTNPRIDYDNNGSGSLRFYSMSAAQERARITSSGKMIIGDVNTDTTDALQIQSPASGGGYGIQIRRDDSNADQQMGRILFGNNTNNDLAQIAAKTDGATDNSAIFFSTRSSGGSLEEAMRITSNGTIGIGDNNPPSSVKLAIQADGIGLRLDGTANTTRTLFFRNTTASNPAQIYSDGSLRLRTEDANTSILFHTNSSGTDNERMRIDSSGNVGIGTDNPATRLHSHSTSGSPEIRLTTGLDTGTPMSQIGYSSGSGYFLRLADASNNEDIMFRTYGDSYIANNLGIGVSSPGQKLHVNSAGTNVVARFESTDGIASIQLKDSTGNVELETYNGIFRVNPGGAANPYSFTSGATSNYFTTTTSHSGTNQDFDFTISNLSNSNYGPRVRIYGGGQSGSASSDVPWDNQQGFNTGSLWFDSGEGPSIYGTGIASYAESDFNGNDTPAALAFYTTPDGTGGQTNTAKERFRLRADGTAHFSPTESDTRIYLGSTGGLTGGNNSINVRASGNNMLLNSVGQLIVERTGVQKFLVDETYTKVTTNGSDGYTIKAENTSTGDPGLSMWRAGQAGFGINVRTSTTNYADLMVSTGGQPAYNPGGSTNAPIRIYQNNKVSIPHSAAWSTGIGNTFGSTGNHYMIRTSSSTGNETIIVNNVTSPGSIGILQYRENAGIQGQYLVAANSTGITFTGSSDYRLKENVNNLTASSLDRINQLRLITYNWNDLSGMPTDEEQIGVLAHEMEEVFPEFVEGEKDAVYTQEDLDARGDPETTNEEVGDIKAQTVSLLNKDMIVHILKGMQELKAENDALRARIEVLESN